MPEFLFGGAAFRERGIPIRMHSRTAGLMASRCETCLKTLRQIVGEEAMRGTTMYKADQEFDATHELDLIGRPVQVLYFGHSSGPGDIAVLDRRSGVLYAGGLLDARRVPDIQDSDLPGWHKALNELQALRVATVVPGHGAAASASPLIATNRRYLMQLEAANSYTGGLGNLIDRCGRRQPSCPSSRPGTSTTRSIGATPRSRTFASNAS